MRSVVDMSWYGPLLYKYLTFIKGQWYWYISKSFRDHSVRQEKYKQKKINIDISRNKFSLQFSFVGTDLIFPELCH